MSNEGFSTPRSGLGVWPKALVWGAVIVIGFLYIRSVAHREPMPAAPAQAPIASKISAPPPTAKAPYQESAQGKELTHVEETEPDVTAKTRATASEPVTEPAQRSEENISTTSEPGRPQEVSTSMEKIPPEGGSSKRTAVAEPAGVEETPNSADAVASEEQKAATQTAISDERPVRADAKFQEKTEDPASAVAEVTKEGIPPAGLAPSPRVPPKSATAQSRQTLETERARILAEYESMRKAAEEEWRMLREQWGAPPAPHMPIPRAPSVPDGPAVSR